MIAVLKSINKRHFGAKKFPLLSKQENTHYNHYAADAVSCLTPDARNKTYIGRYICYC
ncbi:MAG: hypothetical protein IK103_02865 [Bacteroidales bacterium]|nr:hypothetical protein [Bacteroidales bacterium]MBR6465443.1 hypothetical protein [Bacteroidales bacterium]